jgi:enoyl-[acyl-carrier protein] reductase I
MSRLAGKVGLIVGVANKRSIAWAIAQAAAAEGASLILTYQNERLGENVQELGGTIPNVTLLPCDVTSEEQVTALFSEIQRLHGGLDFLVHGVAYALREDLSAPFVQTSREGFRMALDVSAYSLVALSRGALPLMEARGGGSILTLTYLGSQRVFTNYNVMGVAKAALEASVRYLAADLGPKNIRVNAISAGPIKTLAFAGIADSRYILKWNEYNSPLRRTVSIEEVGSSALFLLSDMGKAVTGETMHVDAGYHIVGMKAVDAPDIAVAKSE